MVRKSKTIKSTVRAKTVPEALRKLKIRMLHPKEWVPIKVRVVDSTKLYEVTFRQRKKRKK